jgi:hypothetical protein
VPGTTMQSFWKMERGSVFCRIINTLGHVVLEEGH